MTKPLAQARTCLYAGTRPTLFPVINASGVVLHTNLGRAPLSKASLQVIEEAARNYSNLEFDILKGKRGSRLDHAEAVLQRLLGSKPRWWSTIMLRPCCSASALWPAGGGWSSPARSWSRSAAVSACRCDEAIGGQAIRGRYDQRVHLSDYERALEETWP